MIIQLPWCFELKQHSWLYFYHKPAQTPNFIAAPPQKKTNPKPKPKHGSQADSASLKYSFTDISIEKRGWIQPLSKLRFAFLLTQVLFSV